MRLSKKKIEQTEFRAISRERLRHTVLFHAKSFVIYFLCRRDGDFVEASLAKVQDSLPSHVRLQNKVLCKMWIVDLLTVTKELFCTLYCCCCFLSMILL